MRACVWMQCRKIACAHEAMAMHAEDDDSHPTYMGSDGGIYVMGREV
jgi:hypothetical protein